MFRVFRHVLVLLLMLTLPLQGVSAALMAVTGSHHETISSAADDCHGHDATAFTGNSAADTATPHVPLKAKVCCSTCYGVMAISEIPPHRTGETRHHYSLRDLHAPEGIVPDSLERPPRRIS